MRCFGGRDYLRPHFPTTGAYWTLRLGVEEQRLIEARVAAESKYKVVKALPDDFQKGRHRSRARVWRDWPT